MIRYIHILGGRSNKFLPLPVGTNNSEEMNCHQRGSLSEANWLEKTEIHVVDGGMRQWHKSKLIL
jgi:hypothetical protein